MAVTASWYLNGLKHANSDVDYLTDTIKVLLTTVSYVPNQDTHEYKSDVTNELATANGYTLRGATLGTKTLTIDGATNQLRFDGADVTWTPGAAETLTARIAVVYKDTGTDATSPLLGWVDFGEDVSATNAAFTIQWDATGILRSTAA